MTDPSQRPLGVVLAGGESRRFGSPKGQARLAGRTLVERARRTLAPFCDSVIVAGGDDLPDLRPGRGPLGGIEAALERADRGGLDGALVLACDLPAVHAATVARLLEAWRGLPTPRRGVSVPDEPLQPLCGVWGTDLRGAVSAALDADRGSARDLVRDWPETALVSATELADEVGLLAPQLLHNVNRSEDLAQAAGLLIPPVVGVVGWKDSGKTTVAVALVSALIERGIDAVVAKHGHRFRLDTEGTDSWRFRTEARARNVLLAGPDEMALLGRWRGRAPGLGGLVRRYLRDAEVVVAEGWKEGPWPAIEVRAPASEQPALYDPAAPEALRFIARVVGDDVSCSRPGDPPHYHRDDLGLGEMLADLVEERILGASR